MRTCVLLAAGAAVFLSCQTMSFAQDESGSGYRPAAWLQLNGEARVRSEVGTFAGFETHALRFASFTRIRLNAEIAPFRWLRFAAQAQDARTVHSRTDLTGEMQDNFVDLQYGFAEFGAPEGGPWNVRVGRQLLSFGDERLVGADPFWDNRAQAFNGVRATLNRGAWRWDLFSATPVEVRRTRPDPFSSDERLSGVYGHWSGSSGLVAEPYLLWDRVRPQSDGEGSGDTADRWTPGLRISAPLLSGFDTVTEIAIQRGRAAALPVSAWAGYWELGYRWKGREEGPRVMFSYSYGSGDRDGDDQRIGAFHDRFSGNYTECGFFDLFTWRNIRDFGAGADWTFREKWLLSTEWHGYWLATINDALYADGGEVVISNPQARSARLGSRVMASAQRRFGRHVEMAAGYARFWRGAYLKPGMAPSHSAFISWTARL